MPVKNTHTLEMFVAFIARIFARGKPCHGTWDFNGTRLTWQLVEYETKAEEIK